VVDYVAFFAALAGIEPQARQTGVGDEIVAITAMTATTTGWSVRFVSGTQGLPPLFYDPETGTESTADIGGRIVATATWAFIDAAKRLAAIDVHRPGVPVAVMAKAIAHLGRELGLAAGLTISLNPVPSPSFLAELDRFDRIRQAAIVLERPNYNWYDSATELAGYAGDSDAATLEVEASAERGRSLSTESGIVPDVRALAASSVGPVKNLRVTGTRAGESRETTLSLASHQEKRFVPVQRDTSPSVERDLLQAAASEFLTELPGAEPHNAP
jgi:hypothetical protein